MRTVIVSILSISLASCATTRFASCEFANESKISAAEESFFIGLWFSKTVEPDSTERKDCTFYKDHAYTCEINERGAINPERTLYEANQYWDKGTWSFSNNQLRLYSTFGDRTYKVSTQSPTIFRIEYPNGQSTIYYMDKNCLKSS